MARGARLASLSCLNRDGAIYATHMLRRYL
jgi:uncharacterized protein YjhX (UPF0386 family)